MNTFGWDTVYVLTVDKINAALLAGKDKLILKFDTKQSTELPVMASGNFSKWEIVSGGSGTILYLKISIGNGKVLFTDTNQQYDLTGMALIVAVQLTLLPAQALEQARDLRFDIRSLGEIGMPSQPGTITPVSLQGTEGKLDAVQSVLLMIALSGSILENVAQLIYVFATINLVPPSENNWLTPVHCAYAYMSRDNAPGALAILSVTTDRNITGLPLQVDGRLLSPGFDASFAVSKELFLKNVIQPALPAVFRNGAKPGNFVYDPAIGCIRSTQIIKMNGIKSGAITYYPEISYCQIGTNGAGLVSKYEGFCDLKAGISMKFWIDPRNEAIYNNGSKTLVFLADPDPKNRHEVHIPWYWFFAGLIVRAVMELIVRAIGNSIAEAVSLDIGKYITLIKNPPSFVHWTGTDKLDVQKAYVNVGFYMQGNYKG